MMSMRKVLVLLSCRIGFTACVYRNWPALSDHNNSAKDEHPVFIQPPTKSAGGSNLTPGANLLDIRRWKKADVFGQALPDAITYVII
jgi:hypothetical protein